MSKEFSPPRSPYHLQANEMNIPRSNPISHNHHNHRRLSQCIFYNVFVNANCVFVSSHERSPCIFAHLATWLLGCLVYIHAQ